MKAHLSRSLAAMALILLGVGLAHPALAQSNLSLLMHGVKVQSLQDAKGRDVAIYFSLLDSGGNPIKDAQVSDFTLMEDDQEVQIQSLALANDEPISVAILLDTSGSMVGGKMDSARRAAAKFISNLQGGDRVAVLTFDTSTVHQIDFTTDHTAARQVVELIQYTPGGGTCLYDALYQTIQLTAEEPAGRRALILLTDGVDEADGRPCSYYTAEDVISLANQRDSRVPIYAIGLGNRVDANALARISRQTSGRYQYADTASQLEALFGRLTDELRSQYVLHYTSAASGGTHTLTLKVHKNNMQDQASLEVDFPALPYSISFTSPAQDAEVTGPFTLAVTISGQGVPIARVQFLANGISIGSDSDAPYELAWDPSGLNAGQIFLEAVAQDAAGGELARSGLSIVYQPASLSEKQPSLAIPKLSNTTIIIFSTAGGLILLGILVIALLATAKKRRHEKERDDEWRRTVQGIGETDKTASEDQTMDFFSPTENALGVLVVLDSDDATMIHKRIEITKPVTHLGRKTDNDIVFAKDSPVSRRHAVIEERNGQLFLSEVMTVDETGRPKPPTYGTFINGTQVRDSVPLRNGDEIQLGKRVRLRFESLRPADADREHTIDQLSANGDETMDFK